MKPHLISINDLPPDGKEFTLDDQEIWTEPIKQFKMDCRITDPIHARIFVQPVEEGILIRGNINGGVVVPCNRCAEDASEKIDSEFSEFEDVPEEAIGKHENQEGCVVYENHRPMLNLADVAWEQFMLALPTQPLCREDCKGLCPQCGANINNGECGCSKESGDPRLAALRNVKIK